jgi:hypothetical protein
MSYTNGLDDPAQYFNTITYTGNDTDGRTITGVGFQSDWTWVKARSSAFSPYIIDAIRYDSGASKYLKLDSSSNAADETPSGAGWISALNSDGYVCKNGTSNTNNCNENGVTYVAWNWLGANGTASNTDGSITSTVSANTAAGFSIVSYTGTGSNATVGHGLSSIPKMVIVKDRGNVIHWLVGGDNIGWTKNLYLSLSSAEQTYNHFQDQSPSSSVVYMTSDAALNGSSRNYIMYCFAEKKGYSKFGGYTGNGNADGTFVYTGFKPAWVMYKRTNTGADWHMYDNKRDPINQVDLTIFTNSSSAEASGDALDFLSNGFKQRNTGAEANGSGDSYIYMAFAENPFVNSNGVPTNAR